MFDVYITSVHTTASLGVEARELLVEGSMAVRLALHLKCAGT
jgi:hypothetical protein